MDPGKIGWILLAVIALILFFSFLLGAKRGLKKGIFRFVWLLVTGLIFWFLTPTISEGLNSFNLASFNIDISGPVNKLSDIGLNLLNEAPIPESIKLNSTVQSLVSQAPVLVLNTVVFILLFFLADVVLWPVWMATSSHFFDKSERALKKYNKKVKKLKKKGLPINEEPPVVIPPNKKNRFTGGLIGLVTGLCICAIALSPVVGINNIYQKANASILITNEEGEDVPLLSTLIKDEKVMGYINAYENSVASKVMTYSGMGLLSNLTFQQMANIKVNGKKISLVNELSNGLDVCAKGVKVYQFVKKIKTASKEEMAEFLGDIQEVVVHLDKSSLLGTLGDELMPILVDEYFVKNDGISLSIGGVDYAQLLKDTYVNATSDKPLTIASLESQLDAIIDIGRLLNGNRLLIPLINGEVKDFNSVIQFLSDNVGDTSRFGTDLMNDIFNITLLEPQYATLADKLIKNLYLSLGIEGFKSKDDIKLDGLKESLSALVESALKFLKNYSSGFEFKDADEALENLGRAIDTVHSDLISPESYTALVSFLKTKIKDMLGSFESKFDSLIDKIAEVESWEREFRCLSPLYTTVMDVKDGKEDGIPLSADSIMDGSFKYSEDIGDAIQQVIDSDSELITNKNLRDVFESFLSIVSSDMGDYLNIEVEDGKTLKAFMLDNIWDDNANTSKITSWGDELKYSIAVIQSVKTSLVGFDSASLDLSDKLGSLGKSLDDALLYTHLFLTKESLRAIFDNFFTNFIGTDDTSEIYKIFMEFKEDPSALTIKERVINNVYNPLTHISKVTSWERELSDLASLLKASFDPSNLTEIGKLLDGLSGNKIFSRDIAITLVKHYVEDEADKITDIELGTIKSGILSNISKDKDESGNIVNYEKETKYMLDLVDCITKTDYVATGDESADEVKYEAIGREIDELCGNTPLPDEETIKSAILTKDVFNNFLLAYISKFEKDTDTDIQTIITTVKGNVSSESINITSYETEFKLMFRLMDEVKKSTITLEKVGKLLDDTTSSQIITEDTRKNLIDYYLDKETSSDKYNDYSGIVSDVKINMKGSNKTYTERFGELNTLIGYMDTITTLDSLSSSNASTIGGYLDNMNKNLSIVGEKVTYNIAVEMFSKVDVAGTTTSVLNYARDQQGFPSSYDASSFTPGNTYYTDLLTSMFPATSNPD